MVGSLEGTKDASMTEAKLNFMRRYQRTIWITFCIFLIGWWARVPLMNFLRWIVDREAVADYMISREEWAMVVYLALLILQVIVALIPGQALVLAAGYLFGFLPTLLATVPVAVLSSQFAFYLARRFGKPIAYRLASQKAIDRWEGISHNQGILFYFLAFNLPIFPSDVMCYLAGLGTISGLRFLAANVLGRFVSTTFTVAVGAYGFELPPWFWISSIGVITLLYSGWVAYARWNNIPAHNKD